MLFFWIKIYSLSLFLWFQNGLWPMAALLYPGIIATGQFFFSFFFFSCKVRITSILKSKLKISQNNSISIFSSPNLQAIFILQSPELNEVKIMFSFNIILPAFKNLTLKYECWHLSLYIFIYWRSEAWTNPIDWGEK